LSVLNTNVGSQSASQCRLAIVPDFVAVPGIAKAAEGKYQVIDEGDLGPRRMGYFISGSSRLYGEPGEYAVERERGFESPEKPLHANRFIASLRIEFRCGYGPTERLTSGG